MKKLPFALALLFLTNAFSQNAPDTAGKMRDSLVEAPLEKEPVLVNFVKADYPQQLLAQGVAGTVTLDLLVNEKGSVDSVAVRQGVHPRLDSAVMAAAGRFVFTPAIAGSKPVPVLMTYEYHVRLDDFIRKIEDYVNLSGIVIERGTRAPVCGATLYASCTDTTKDSLLGMPFSFYLKKIGSFAGQHLQGNDLITTTDSLGRFSFRSLPAGPCRIVILSPGCERFSDVLDIVKNRSLDVKFRVDRLAYSNDEIVVYGRAEKKEVAQSTLTLNEVRKIPGFGGDAVKVIQALPGVARSPLLSGRIIVRGSGGGDTHFFVDGITIPVLFHFGGVTSTYNSEALSSVDLYPGGFGTRYGNALGGVVEITGRKPKTDRIHGYADANVFDASLLIEGPLSDKLSFLATARRSYIADVIAFFLKRIARISLPFTVAPYYWDYITRLDYSASRQSHLYLTLFGSGDRLDFTVNEVRGGTSQIDAEKNRATDDTYFHLGIAGWDWKISNRFNNSLRYALCNLTQNTKAFGFFKVNGSALAHYLRDEFSFAASDALTANAGLDVQVIPYKLNLTTLNASNEVVRDVESYKMGPYGAYCNLAWKATSRLTLCPGLRYDYYPELTYSGAVVPEFWTYGFLANKSGVSGEPSFRLSGRYQINPQETAKFSVGTYNETPQPVGQAIDKVWGNTALPAQNGSQYVIGYERKFSPLLSADVQVYFNTQWDDARRPSAEERAADPSLPNFISNGEARMAGLEIMLKHEQSGRFFGWIAYSLSRSERRRQNSFWALYSQDQTHNLQLIGSYKITRSQEVGLRLRYVTGNPTTPIYPSTTFDAGPARAYVPTLGPFNSDRVEPYISLDMRWEKTFTYDKWLWHLYIDITHLENLFGKGYQSPETGQYRWNYDYTSKVKFYDITRPAFGIRVDF